jgi:dTDP-4-dehydrorhamnose reductase
MIGRGGMARQSVAILGGRGMLGTDAAAACADRGLDIQVYDLPGFDLTKTEHVERAVENADAVINCAAYTNVDGAESHAELAHRVNAEAVGHLGEIAAKAGKWVLHISTDFVFDGTLDRPYAETDAPNPINEYGRSKLSGERFLDASGCSRCIVRVEWTYGRHGSNFVAKLLDRARSGQALKVVDDQVGSPTATSEVAEILCTLLERRTEGLFHLAAAGFASRYEVGRFILDQLHLDTKLEPCRTSDFVSPANRPLNSRFNCDKIQHLLNRSIDNWQGPLGRFLGQL